MQKYVVPQFIDIEDKVIGPITVRQFILMVVGGVLIFLTFKFADISLFLVLTILILFLVFLFGFFKVNGAPFHLFLLNLITTLKKPSLRVWRKDVSGQDLEILLKREKVKDEKNKKINKKSISLSRLSELSLVVDTRGHYKGEN